MSYTLKIYNKKTGNLIGNTDDEGEIFVEKGTEFIVNFKNNTPNQIQARLSIDGTDVLTGGKASTNPAGRVFLVDPYDYLELLAWPETDESGRQFIFSDEKKGVSKNTHGDTSGLGLIAVAVFTESEPPVRIRHNYYNKISDHFKRLESDPGNVTKGVSKGSGSSTLDSMDVDYSRDYSQDDSPIPVGVASSASEGEYYSCNINISSSSRRDTKSTRRREEKISVGAGNNVDQIIKHATKGLIKPVFDRVIQFKYSLKNKEYKAFPGDKKPKVFNDLKSVPRA